MDLETLLKEGKVEQRLATKQEIADLLRLAAESLARYLQKCRKIRNMSTYSRSGIVSRVEVEELISRTENLRTAVCQWLGANCPEYC